MADLMRAFHDPHSNIYFYGVLAAGFIFNRWSEHNDAL